MNRYLQKAIHTVWNQCCNTINVLWWLIPLICIWLTGFFASGDRRLNWRGYRIVQLWRRWHGPLPLRFACRVLDNLIHLQVGCCIHAVLLWCFIMFSNRRALWYGNNFSNGKNLSLSASNTHYTCKWNMKPKKTVTCLLLYFWRSFQKSCSGESKTQETLSSCNCEGFSQAN